MTSNRQLFLHHLAPTSDSPLLLEISGAEGIYLFSTENEPIIDLISGIAVSNLGHGNKEVGNAIKSQVDKHMHLMVYGELIQSPQVELATYLCGHLPENLQSVYFVNSGSEAVEGAIKLARRYTGKKKIAAAKNAYHGNTTGAMSLMSDKVYKDAFEPLLPGVEYFTFNDISSTDFINEEYAAIIIEPIQGEAGYIPSEQEFMLRLKEICREKNCLLIFDEIQCGMGRTGSLFAFEQYGIVPDILLTAKAFGAGMPLGAFISSKEIMSSLSNNPVLGHITTFGGHPVSCAASLAGLKFMTENDVIGQVKAKEEIFRAALKHPFIKSISGKGLMLALEFEDYTENKKIIDRCIEKGLLTDWFLFAPNKMRISPPLIINKQEIEKACEIILEVLEEVGE